MPAPSTAARRRLLRARADAGDAQAQFDLACDYDFEPPKRKRLAIEWYLRAAEGGHVEAQNSLGEAYRDGDDVRKSRPRAVEWFRRAAAGGDSEAQLSLGYALFYGEGVARDRAAALRWYRRSARRGNAAAMANIARMYRRGQGVPQSLEHAVRWYLCAAVAGDPRAFGWIREVSSTTGRARSRERSILLRLVARTATAAAAGDARARRTIRWCRSAGVVARGRPPAGSASSRIPPARPGTLRVSP